MHLRWWLLLFPWLLACGGDDPPTGPLPLNPADCAGDGVDYSDCDVTLEPGADDTKTVQTALIEAESGTHVCFCPGSYSFEKEISLTVPDVTLKGIGASRDDVVLDFAAQTVGDDGLTVTSDGFTIQSLALKNTPGNGIVVTGADDVRFSDLHVSWDAGSVEENGAYAVYPVKSKRVIVEDCEVEGAADAGIYVGQCEQALVRNNVVHGNVAGIEIENTTDAEVVGNEAYDNTAGILVFVLPDLEKKDGMRCKIHDNSAHDNNRENFAVSGTVVAFAPAGVGVLLLAANQVELHDNTIENNDSTAFLLVSYTTLAPFLGGGEPDPETDPYLESIYIHDNTLSGNGSMPRDILLQLMVPALEDVIWDGEVNAAMPTTDNVCLGPNPPSFRTANGAANISDPTMHTTDTTGFECVGETQAPVDL